MDSSAEQVIKYSFLIIIISFMLLEWIYYLKLPRNHYLNNSHKHILLLIQKIIMMYPD